MTSARIGSGLGSYSTSQLTHFSGSNASSLAAAACCGASECAICFGGLNFITRNVRRMGSNFEDGNSTDPKEDKCN
jgi:hypothetical protein